MAENLDYEQLKLDHAEHKITDGQYVTKLEELCDALISSLDPQDSKAQIISLILNPNNPDMKGEAKQFAMESVLR